MNASSFVEANRTMMASLEAALRGLIAAINQMAGAIDDLATFKRLDRNLRTAKYRLRYVRAGIRAARKRAKGRKRR